MNTITMRFGRQLRVAAALCGVLTGCGDRKPPTPPTVPPQQFATPEEAASALGLATRTAERTWTFARAWLKAEIRGEAKSDLPI